MLEIILFKSETKKISLSLKLSYRFKILFFLLTFKRWFEINLVIFCPGSGLEPHPDLHWPNFVDPDPHTINADHWLFNHSFLASKRIKNKFVSKNSVKNVGNFFFYFFLPVFVLNEFLYESVCHLLTYFETQRIILERLYILQTC